jgi:hypothetical protein
LRDRPRFGCDEIPQDIRRVIAADAVLVAIHFQNVLWPVWIMLQHRQSFNQATAAFVNK